MAFAIFLGLFFLTTAHKVTAQRCANGIYDSIRFAKNPQLKELRIKFEKDLQKEVAFRKAARVAEVSGTIITIPVVVHVLYNTDAQNISDAQVYSQIDALNRDYRKKNADTANTRAQFRGVAADMEIQFCMAATEQDCYKGITRHYVSQNIFSPGIDDPIIKSKSLYPTDQYLNIWVCNLAGGYLGYAQLPSYSGLPGLSPEEGDSLYDGVVIATRAFGTTGTGLSTNYNLGRTATHEVGHWLGGLIHTWGDVDCSSGSCAGVCGTDYCDDTPYEEKSTQNCEPRTTNLCGPTPSVVMIENFMDYTYDRCMSLFTADQKTRLHAALHTSPRRMRLLSAPCGTVQYGKNFPLYEGFEEVNWQNDGWRINTSGNSKYPLKRLAYGAYGQSNYCLGLDHDTVGNQHELVFPYLADSSKVATPFISFDYAYSNTGTTDELSLYYTNGCQSAWTKLTSFSAADLNTTATGEANFVPKENTWVTRLVDVSKIANLTGGRLKFVWNSNSGNNFYLDNININKKEFSYSLYPNPANDRLTFEMSYLGYENIKIEIYDVFGHKAMEHQFEEMIAQKLDYPITGLSSGVYIARITHGGSTETSKFIVLK